MELRNNTAPRRAGLGRGLATLIPEAARVDPDGPRAAFAGAAVLQIPVDEITANPDQPRRRFTELALSELTASVKEKGVLSPILVRPLGQGYEIVAGERRYRAAIRAGLRTIPAVVREMDTKESLEIALIENLQREDLNPIEAAEAYQRLVDDFGYNQEALARRLGKDRSSVSNVLRLLKLPEVVRQALSDGTISMGHGRALLGLSEPERIEEVFRVVVGGSLSVRQTEDLVRQQQSEKKVRRTAKDLATPFLDVQDRLARHFGTRVRLKPRASGDGGKIVIEYYSQRDLDRLIDRIETPTL